MFNILQFIFFILMWILTLYIYITAIHMHMSEWIIIWKIRIQNCFKDFIFVGRHAFACPCLNSLLCLITFISISAQSPTITWPRSGFRHYLYKLHTIIYLQYARIFMPTSSSRDMSVCMYTLMKKKKMELRLSRFSDNLEMDPHIKKKKLRSS